MKRAEDRGESSMEDRVKSLTLRAAACSNKGCRRSNNEDNFCLNGVYMPREEMDQGGLYQTETQIPAIFAVCDGMGGEEAGEEASLLSAQLCSRYMKDGAMSADSKALHAFFLDGCISVMKQAQRNGNHSGSTVSLIIADETGLHAANMGDSRIYRLTDKALMQISEDHTEVQRLLKKGVITKSQIKTHPKRHMIRQYWGMPLSVAPFSPYFAPELPYVNGERFLICSDGLTDMVEDHEIEKILRGGNAVEQICQELVDEALRHGGKDNVTVLVLEVQGETDSCSRKENAHWWNRIKRFFAGKGN